MNCPYCKTPLSIVGWDEGSIRHHILCCHLAALCIGLADPRITVAFENHFTFQKMETQQIPLNQ